MSFSRRLREQGNQVEERLHLEGILDANYSRVRYPLLSFDLSKMMDSRIIPRIVSYDLILMRVNYDAKTLRT